MSPKPFFDKIGTIQRRLAWPLRKDDTHKSRSVASKKSLVCLPGLGRKRSAASSSLGITAGLVPQLFCFPNILCKELRKPESPKPCSPDPTDPLLSRPKRQRHQPQNGLQLKSNNSAPHYIWMRKQPERMLLYLERSRKQTCLSQPFCKTV